MNWNEAEKLQPGQCLIHLLPFWQMRTYTVISADADHLLLMLPEDRTITLYFRRDATAARELSFFSVAYNLSFFNTNSTKATEEFGETSCAPTQEAMPAARSETQSTAAHASSGPGDAAGNARDIAMCDSALSPAAKVNDAAACDKPGAPTFAIHKLLHYSIAQYRQSHGGLLPKRICLPYYMSKALGFTLQDYPATIKGVPVISNEREFKFE